MIIYILILVFYYDSPNMAPVTEYKNDVFFSESECMAEGLRLVKILGEGWKTPLFHCKPFNIKLNSENIALSYKQMANSTNKNCYWE